MTKIQAFKHYFIIRKNESISQFADRIALVFSIIVGVFIGLVILFFNWNRNPVPMLQDKMGFGVITLLLTPIIVFMMTAFTYYLGIKSHNSLTSKSYNRKWVIGVLPLSIAYAIIVAFLIIILIDLINNGFRNLELALFTAVAVSVLISGALTQWALKQAVLLNSSKLLEISIIILAGGIYLTATQVENPEWWRISFSYLGSLKSNANIIFNSTLVFGALLIASWIPYFKADLSILVNHNIAIKNSIKWMSIGLWWIAIGIALVGIFKTQSTPVASVIHNLAAYSLAGVFGLLMFKTNWLFPGISNEFKTLTFILRSMLIISLILASIGYFNTVGLEVIAFSLGIMWLQSLTRFNLSLAKRLEPNGYPL